MSVSNRKKILFLITKSNWGGAQRYVFDIATKLDPLLFEPVVALGGNGTLKEQLEHAGIRVIVIESLERDISIKKELAFAKELWQVLKTEKPNVFHVNSSKAGGVGTFLGRIARVPRVIFTSHGWAFNEDRPYWQRFVIKGLHWLTVLFSHKTITVSHALINQMNWPLVRTKMKVINPGRTIGVMYNKQEARAKLVEICPALAPHQGDTWILTIAELHPIKRLHVLIHAFKMAARNHQNIRSVIIGDGELRAELETQITELELTDRVFLTGSITEAARFLRSADLFVLPSKSESYGYVLHEAGLAGLPVISSDVGGITDIIKDSHTGSLIKPDDASLLAKQIEDFCERRHKWNDFGNNLQQVMEGRTVEKMVDATVALYTLSLNQ